MFQIGDKAVYPGHGVGIIESIETKRISGKEQIFFILKILENGMTIMIPQDNVEAAKLRGVIRKIDVRKVIGILKDRDVTIDNQTWNRRYREYMEKINTGSIYGIAEVLHNESRRHIPQDRSCRRLRQEGRQLCQLCILLKPPRLPCRCCFSSPLKKGTSTSRHGYLLGISQVARSEAVKKSNQGDSV